MSDAESVSDYEDQNIYPNIRDNPLDDISKTSYILGIVFGAGLPLMFRLKFIGFPMYIMSLSLFHFLEFYITAKFNPLKVDSDSFLINNGTGYTMAQLFAIIECLIETYFFDFKSLSGLSSKVIFTSGLLLVLVGQITRSMAMITCGNSFSHRIMKHKKNDHVLITTGIYQYSRHPSYFGFFWWAIGTQMICLNPVSTVVFAIVLWSFFNKRIKYEEEYLIKFFGKKYVEFKEKSMVGIPFIH